MNSYRALHHHRNLHIRATVLNGIRRFFQHHDFLEVDTPIRIPTPAPEMHIEPVAADGWVLQSSPELCMKRLMAAGMPRLFQICKCFRGRERGRRHLPEFTLLEWYAEEIDYGGFMDQCEALIRSVAAATNTGSHLKYQGRTVSLTGPWPRLTVAEAFARWGSLPLGEALACGRFDEVMVTDIEPNLAVETPVFLCDYPIAHGALARRSPENPEFAQRFELYVCGIELLNAFMELTDPVEQRSRFEHEQREMARLNRQSYPLPEPFLAALGDMPDAAGAALGVDRLVMLFCDAPSIDDVVAFTPEAL